MKRANNLDAVRGMLMFYVVFIVHGFFWLKLVPARPASWLLFEMPMIFMVSGYAYHLQEKAMQMKGQCVNSARTYLKFMVLRFSRVLISYFFYALVCVAIIGVGGTQRSGQAWSVLSVFLAWVNPQGDCITQSSEMVVNKRPDQR